MRLLVADDSALFREGLVGLLERQGHEILAQASNAPELLTMAAAQPADVIITDVRMPPQMSDDGLRAAVQLVFALARFNVDRSAIQRKTAVGDTVSITTNRCAKECRLLGVLLRRCAAQ